MLLHIEEVLGVWLLLERERVQLTVTLWHVSVQILRRLVVSDEQCTIVERTVISSPKQSLALHHILLLDVHRAIFWQT